MEQTIAATHARIHFGEVLRKVAKGGHRIIVERAGRPQAVILSIIEYQQAALSLPIFPCGQATLHRRALGLVGSLALPAVCDAHYLALAKALDAEFWTADRRLVRAVRETLPWVRAPRGGFEQEELPLNWGAGFAGGIGVGFAMDVTEILFVELGRAL